MQVESYLKLQSHTQLRHLIQSVLLFIAYFLTSKLGYLFVFYPEPSAHFWPAAGVSLAFLLMVPPQSWGCYLIAIFMGEVVISLTQNISMTVALAWGVADTLEPALAAGIIWKILKQPIDFTIPKHIAIFLITAVFSPMVGALIGAWASIMWLNAPSFVDTFRTWWFAISLGEILITPFLIAWYSRKSFSFVQSHIMEGLIIICVFLFVTFYIFATPVTANSEYLYKHLLMYLILPLFMWTLLRFEEYGAFTCLLIVNIVAGYFTSRGNGPFAFLRPTPLVRLVSLQTYLSFLTLATMALTAFIKQRKRSEHELNSIIENSTAVIYLKDLSGKYLLVNKGYEKLFNVRRKFVLGKTDFDLYPSAAEVWRKNDERVINEKKAIEFEEGAETANFISVKFPLCDENQEPYAVGGISTDITAFKKASMELEQAIKLRDDFIAIASHELRTPLTPLKLQISLLKRHLNKIAPELMKNEDLFKLIDKSDHEIDQLILLIENLLDVSKMTQRKLVLNREECNLSKVISNVSGRFKTELQKANCSLSLDLQPEVIGHWDTFRLQQVITNLIINAIKYSSSKPINIKLSKIGHVARLEIIDQGIGISKSDQKKIFDRFERAVPFTAYGGLGLGLFIVSEIIKAHNGAIEVHSELNHGSTFIVELPIST